MHITKHTKSSSLSENTNEKIQTFFASHYPSWFPSHRHTIDHEYIRTIRGFLGDRATLFLAEDVHQRIQGLVTTSLEQQKTMDIYTLEWAMTAEKQQGIFRQLFAKVLEEAHHVRKQALTDQKAFFFLTNVYRENPAYQIFEHYGFYPSPFFSTKEGVIMQKVLRKS